MKSISVLMGTFNAKEFISEAIESVLQQSFTDFELIVVNAGASDSVRSVIRTFTDKRIRVVDSEADNFCSLSAGLEAADGKYIAMMDAEDITHIDRLKIQYAIMEAYPEITVCSSWVSIFGEKAPSKTLRHPYSGFVENPLIQFILGNFVCSTASLTRSAFIKEHHLSFEAYAEAEDYKFWAEAAKAGAVFYNESQSLVYKRIVENLAKTVDKDVQKQMESKVRKEILDALCLRYDKYPALKTLKNSLYKLLKNQWMTEEEMVKLLHTLFTKNKDK